MESEPEVGTRTKGSVLTNRSYIAFMMAQLVSFLGTHMHLIALLWLMSILTDHDPLYIGLIGVAEMVPSVILAPLAGVWIDRWNKLRTMRVADLISGTLVAVIATTAYLGVLHPIGLLLLTVLLAGTFVFFWPAKQALMPQVVEAEHLMEANSYSQTISTATMIGGPLLAGI